MKDKGTVIPESESLPLVTFNWLIDRPDKIERSFDFILDG